VQVRFLSSAHLLRLRSMHRKKSSLLKIESF